MKNQIVSISSVEHLNAAYFVLFADVGAMAYEVKAGQFFQIKRTDISFPMLRKPVSVHDVAGENVAFMIKKVGKGTELLSHLKAGDKLDILGPLGNGFPITTGKKSVLVSGGIGYPPLWMLKKELLKAQNQFYWLHGGQNSSDIFPADEIWTDDGSYGSRGYVTLGLSAFLAKSIPDVIYACGPDPMLRECARIAKEHNIPLYVSLEAYMACGIGVCHGCAVTVKADNEQGFSYKNVCQDGPVFDADEIVWEREV